MADEVLFDFLHMEMVSHVYKEQRSSKGELDSKVRVHRLEPVSVCDSGSTGFSVHMVTVLTGVSVHTVTVLTGHHPPDASLVVLKFSALFCHASFPHLRCNLLKLGVFC